MTRKEDTDINAKTKCALADFCLLHVSLAVFFCITVIPDSMWPVYPPLEESTMTDMITREPPRYSYLV